MLITHVDTNLFKNFVPIYHLFYMMTINVLRIAIWVTLLKSYYSYIYVKNTRDHELQFN